MFNLLLRMLKNNYGFAVVTHGGTLPDSSAKSDFYSIVDNATVSSIINADVSNSAAIAYAKLALTGAILNADLAGSIADSKLSQITTASKVSGAALTSLSSVPVGAGALPLLNMTSACSIVQTTYNMTTASGNQTITGAGFTPSKVIVLAVSSVGSTSYSVGMDDLTTHSSIYQVASGNTGGTTSFSMEIQETNSNSQEGKFTSFNSDGGVIAWTKSGTPTGTATLIFMFFR